MSPPGAPYGAPGQQYAPPGQQYVPTGPQYVGPPGMPPKKNRTPLLIGLGVVVAAAAGFAAYTFLGSDDDADTTSPSSADVAAQAAALPAGVELPVDIPVGGCVNLQQGEDWATATGLAVVDCGSAHQGQVFAQDNGFDGDEGDAQTQCDEARSAAIQLPGFVNWWAYWNPGLTCVLHQDDNSTLTGSIVTT